MKKRGGDLDFLMIWV